MSAKYVMCINNEDYGISLTPRKVYKVISTEKEEQGGWVRVVDDTGEDYLFPARAFVPVEVPAAAEPIFDPIAA